MRKLRLREIKQLSKVIASSPCLSNESLLLWASHSMTVVKTSIEERKGGLRNVG